MMRTAQPSITVERLSAGEGRTAVVEKLFVIRVPVLTTESLHNEVVCIARDDYYGRIGMVKSVDVEKQTVLVEFVCDVVGDPIKKHLHLYDVLLRGYFECLARSFCGEPTTDEDIKNLEHLAGFVFYGSASLRQLTLIDNFLQAVDNLAGKKICINGECLEFLLQDCDAADFCALTVRRDDGTVVYDCLLSCLEYSLVAESLVLSKATSDGFDWCVRVNLQTNQAHDKSNQPVEFKFLDESVDVHHLPRGKQLSPILEGPEELEQTPWSQGGTPWSAKSQKRMQLRKDHRSLPWISEEDEPEAREQICIDAVARELQDGNNPDDGVARELFRTDDKTENVATQRVLLKKITDELHLSETLTADAVVAAAVQELGLQDTGNFDQTVELILSKLSARTQDTEPVPAARAAPELAAPIMAAGKVKSKDLKLHHVLSVIGDLTDEAALKGEHTALYAAAKDISNRIKGVLVEKLDFDANEKFPVKVKEPWTWSAIFAHLQPLAQPYKDNALSKDDKSFLEGTQFVTANGNLNLQHWELRVQEIKSRCAS